MNIGKPSFNIDDKVRESYPNIDKLLQILDLQYLTPNFKILGSSCPVRVAEVDRKMYDGKIMESTLGFFPEDENVNSIWYGKNIRRAIKKGIVELGLAYDCMKENNPRIRFALTKNYAKRVINRLTNFPRKQEINFYLHPKND